MILERLTEKIVRFAEKINNFRLRPYQEARMSQIVSSIILGETGTYTNLWARQIGKTETIKAAVLSLMSVLPDLAQSSAVDDFPQLRNYKDGFLVAIAGPKGYTASIPFKRIRRQARTKVFQETLAELGLSIIASNTEYFELSNFSMAQAFSGSETASNEGIDASILICEESQRLSAFSFYKILRPMVAASGGLILSSGTSHRKRCPFLNDIEYNLRTNRKLHQSVPYTEVIKYSRPYKKFIEGEIARLPGGMENQYFRMNYLLEWILAQGRFVDPNFFLTLKTLKRGEHLGQLFGGVDWGKAGSKTAVTILGRDGEAAKVVDLLHLSGDYDEQFEYLVPFLRSYFARGMAKLVSETNAAGDPNTERLKKIFGKNKVVGLYTCATSKDRVFTNLQTEITGSRFRYFQDNSSEALAFEREFLEAEQEVKGNLLSVHKPDEEGSSDDFLISTALALSGLQQTPTLHVSGVTTGRKRASYEELRDY